MKLSYINSKIGFNVLLVICVGLWVTQFGFILKYAVNIPYWDEWEAINTNGILVNQTLSQLFAQHNEHRIVTTKLLTLLLYYFDGWNIIVHQAINFIIYGLLIITVTYIVKKSIPELSALILLCFVFFMLSDVSIQNHFWGFQSQFHFSLLFLFLSVWFLFNEKQEWRKILSGTVFSILGIYSFSSGLVEAIVVLTGYSLFKIIRIYSGNERKREILQTAIVILFISAAIGLYFVGYTKPAGNPDLTFPYQKLFWTYLLNLFSGGFGYKIDNILPGTIIFFFTLIPIIGVIKKDGYKIASGKWIIIISTLAVLAALGSITMGRAAFGKGQSKASRYTEITIMLIPLSVAMWTVFLNERQKLRNYLLIGFWIFCGFGLSRCWNFPKAYYEMAVERQQARDCVQNYYKNGGEADCPTAYPHPIADRLEFERNLPLSFIKEMQK